MANRLLRNIAVKIGAGLATFSLPPATPQTRRQIPDFTPVLTRIEDIESRVARVEQEPAPAVPSVEEIEALGTLVSSQSEDIAGLHQAILKIESQSAERTDAFERKVALVEHQLPTYIETAINARMTDLEQRLRGEFQQIHHQTIDAFAETVENRVIGRIVALENSLAEQSRCIVSLREKSFKTDDNLQRLLEAVEKLCARAEAQAHIAVLAPAPPAEPPKAAESFESLYKLAISREVARDTVAAPGKAGVEPQQELAFAGAAYKSPSPRGMKAVGFAIIGLAALGLRFMR